jgi:hypothetical protein
MPALSGQVISTLTDENGQPLIVLTYFFDPATYLLRNSLTSWTSPSGKTYPAGSALIADNGTGRVVSVVVNNPETGSNRTFSIPATDRKLTLAQLLAIPAPNGPVQTVGDLAGLSFDLS